MPILGIPILFSGVLVTANTAWLSRQARMLILVDTDGNCVSPTTLMASNLPRVYGLWTGTAFRRCLTSQTAHTDQIHRYLRTPRYGAAGRAGEQGHEFVSYSGYFLRRLHIMLTQCQSKTINIPNLASIGRQVLLTIMAVHYRRRDIVFFTLLNASSRK